MQLDLFLSETDILKEELKKQKTLIENVRRGLFARHNEICKEVMRLSEELEQLKMFVAFKKESNIINFNKKIV